MKKYYTYYIFNDTQYGILQTEKTHEEVYMLVDEGVRVQRWTSPANIQEEAEKKNKMYVGYDLFYK